MNTEYTNNKTNEINDSNERIKQMGSMKQMNFI